MHEDEHQHYPERAGEAVRVCESPGE
jgi:hypothetical protein